MHAFDVLGDPVRRRILELLASGEMSAGEISATIGDEFAISQPAVSQHLKVLRDNGFASVRPDGQRRLYSVEPAALRDVDEWLAAFRRFWAPRLDALGTESHAVGANAEIKGDKMFDVDVDYEINAVARTFGTRTIESGEAYVATIGRTYHTDQDDLWDAVTNIERIPRWLMPITGNLEVGGRYQLEGHAGGTVLTCDPPKNFTATWESMGAVSWIDVSVHSEGPDRARLVVEHVAQVDDATARMFGPGAVGMGWESMLLGLAIHLRTGDSVDPAVGQEWLATPDGRRFLTASSEGWYAANVAFGEDPAAAREMADRCLAAYLGEEGDGA